MAEIIIKNEYITLPIRLVEEIFPAANATFIKVYMHMLMLAAKGRKIEIVDVAGDLQLLESDGADTGFLILGMKRKTIFLRSRLQIRLLTTFKA